MSSISTEFLSNLKPPAPLASDIRDKWTLDPVVAFLNHGSFGACPKAVLDKQTEWRARLEREPVKFLDRDSMELIPNALKSLGEFLGAPSDELAFVTNATEGIAAVVRSLDLKPGDEMITTAHAYDAIANTMNHVAERVGAKVHHLPIAMPYLDPSIIVSDIEKLLNEKTKLVVVSHITSISSLILPVNDIATLCKKRGVDCVIDGAHAPGMLDLKIESIGAPYYSGNLHKWICAPKGAGFLYARKDKQQNLHPAIISNNYGKGFNWEFGWQGTRDITPWLTAPFAIEYMSQFGWENIRKHNHQMATWAQKMLTEKWGVEPISPLDGSAIGSIVTIPLPKGKRIIEDRYEATAILYEEYGVEIPVVNVNDRKMIRPSCQLYNVEEDYHRLAEAVLKLYEVD